MLQDGEYLFLEMNTRMQVEHCVTEMMTGVDIVREGISVAAGEPLTVTQDDIGLRGHAIECRINAEDAARKFRRPPAGSATTASRRPGHPRGLGGRPGQRGEPVLRPDDREADRLGPGPREGDQAHAARAGRVPDRRLTTHIPFHRALLATDQWATPRRAATWSRTRIGSTRWPSPLRRCADDDEDPKVEQDYVVEVSGRKFDVKVIGPPPVGGVAVAAGSANGAGPAPRKRGERKKDAGGGADELVSPLQGNMWKVLVKQGDTVEEGQLLCIIEAMKMENEITAHKAGVIETLSITEGEPIQSGAQIAIIKSPPAAE